MSAHLTTPIVLAISLHGELEFTSPAWSEVSGYSLEETLGFGYLEQIVPEDRERVLRFLQTSKGSNRWISRCRAKDGRILSMLMASSVLIDGRVALAGTMVDPEGPNPFNLNSLSFLEARLRFLKNNRAERSHRLPTVSFEMDGVLANHLQRILELSWETQSRVFPDWQALTCHSGCQGCNASVCYAEAATRDGRQLSSDEFKIAKLAAIHSPHFWLEIEPFAVSELDEIAELCGSRLAAVFVANRCDTPSGPAYLSDARCQSVNWLNKYGITYYVSTFFHCTDKADELLRQGVQYHLDDDPQEVERLREFGIEAFLVTRPWNKKSPCEYRVDNVSDYLDLVAPAVTAEAVVSDALLAYPY